MLGIMRSRWLTRIACAGSLAIILFFLPAVASADVTAFFGSNRTPSDRSVKGFAIGTGLVIVAFEFEYANTNDDLVKAAPQLRTYFFNGLVQTPIPIARMQFYGTAGAGVYQETLDRETLDELSETNVGIALGGGVKVTLFGPVRLRFDYRVFTLQGSPLHSKPQRFYAGINLKF